LITLRASPPLGDEWRPSPEARRRPNGGSNQGFGSSGYRFYGGDASPEVLEPAQRYACCVKVFVGDISPLQHLGMAVMHALQPSAQFGSLLGEPDSDRSCTK